MLRALDQMVLGGNHSRQVCKSAFNFSPIEVIKACGCMCELIAQVTYHRKDCNDVKAESAPGKQFPIRQNVEDSHNYGRL